MQCPVIPMRQPHIPHPCSRCSGGCEGALLGTCVAQVRRSGKDQCRTGSRGGRAHQDALRRRTGRETSRRAGAGRAASTTITAAPEHRPLAIGQQPLEMIVRPVTRHLGRRRTMCLATEQFRLAEEILAARMMIGVRSAVHKLNRTRMDAGGYYSRRSAAGLRVDQR